MTPDEAVASLSGVQNLLVATDFDGTLAPIVPDPPAARALPSAAAAVRELAALPHTTVAVVSGRGLPELRGLCAESGLPESIVMVGGHGAERGDELPAAVRRRRDTLVQDVAALTAEVPGIRLEEKAGGVAVHVRGVADPRPLLDRLRTLAASHDAGTMDGLLVLELSVLPGDKGSAVSDLRSQTDADAVLFLGDDVTDESVFTVLRPTDVGVKVGPGPTAAAYRVPDPPAVADLLARLATARRG